MYVQNSPSGYYRDSYIRPSSWDSIVTDYRLNKAGLKLGHRHKKSNIVMDIAFGANDAAAVCYTRLSCINAIISSQLAFAASAS